MLRPTLARFFKQSKEGMRPEFERIVSGWGTIRDIDKLQKLHDAALHFIQTNGSENIDVDEISSLGLIGVQLERMKGENK